MNGNQKGTGTVILTSAKLDFKKKKKTLIRVKGWHYIRASIHQEDIVIINIINYSHQTSKLLNIWHILWKLKGEIYSNTIIVVDFNIFHSIVNRATKIQKEIEDFNNTD